MENENFKIFNTIKVILVFGMIFMTGFMLVDYTHQPNTSAFESVQRDLSNIRQVERPEVREEPIRQPVLREQHSSGGDRTSEEASEGGIQSLLRHKGFGDDDIIQEYAKYAFEIGGYNLLALCECENGERGLTRRGDSGLAYGLGQVQLYRFPQIDRDRFLTDYKYQLEQVWKLRKSGVPFYGPTRIMPNGQKCYEYVSNRFIIK